MATLEQPSPDQSTTAARYRRAAEAHDIEGMLDTLAPDIVLRSPITDRVVFQGRDEIRELLQSVFATIHDIRYFADVGDRRSRALFDRAIVNGQPLEQATRIELDADERIREITLFFRPLPGLATLTAELVPRVARKHGRFRATMARLLLAPLGLATRIGDRLATWFT